MSKCRETLEIVKKWLVEGTPKADNLVDLPWEVEEPPNENALSAVYPQFPIKINIVCDDDIGVLRLFVSTNTPTVDLELKDRIIIYHKLLKMNASPLAKFVLYGDDDIIDIAVDLSVKSLGKQEFNDALALLLASVNAVVNELGLEEIIREQMFTEIIRLVSKHIEEGWGREKLIQYLVNRAGMERSDAEKLVDQVLSTIKGSGAPSIYQ